MENEDIAQKSEACMSLKKRLLTSFWEDVSPLLTEVLKLSRHPTEEDAILELSRSELLFVSLLQALRTKNTVMSGRLLLEVEEWEVLPRLSFYLGHKLHVEFNCPGDFFSRAAEFAHTLQGTQLFRVPEKVLAFLDHLAECMRKEIEARISRKERCVSRDLKEEDKEYLEEEIEIPKPVKRRTYRRSKNTERSDLQQVTQAEDSTSSLPTTSHSTISQQQVAQEVELTASVSSNNIQKQLRRVMPTCLSSSNTATTIASPLPPVTRSRAEIEEASEALKVAVNNNDLEAVRSAIEKGADIEKRDGFGWTPLIRAAFNGCVEVIELLIGAGADLESMNNDSDRALHLAAINGRKNAVSRLIAAGADVHAAGWGSRTALHWATSRGHLELMNVLIMAGVDIEATSSAGNRPLHLAACNGRDNAVARLVEAGADLHSIGECSRTPLQWAIYKQHSSTANLLRSLGALK